MKNNEGNSEWSDVISAQPEQVAPATPGNFAVSALSHIAALVEWTNGEVAQDSLQVQRRGEFELEFETIAWIAGNASDYIDVGTLQSTQTYFYRVRSSNIAGSSAWTSIESVTLPSTPTTAVGAPQSALEFTVSQAGGCGSTSPALNLSWTDDADNEIGYRLSRSLSATGPYDVLALLDANTEATVDAAVLAGNTYYYQLEAYNTQGNSDCSHCKCPSSAADGSSHTGKLCGGRPFALADSIQLGCRRFFKHNFRNSKVHTIHRHHQSGHAVSDCRNGFGYHLQDSLWTLRRWQPNKNRIPNSSVGTTGVSPAGPPPLMRQEKLRLINDLGTLPGWKNYNSIISVIIAESEQDISNSITSGNQGLYEYLEDSQYICGDCTDQMEFIAPSGDAETSYRDFDVSSSISANYNFFIRCGWWDPWNNGWQKHYTQVIIESTCTGPGMTNCQQTYKAGMVTATNHQHGYMVGKATELGLPLYWYD